MYAQLKNKGSKKSKEKTKRISIEDGIPVVPQISDFQETNLLVPLNPVEENVDATSSQVLNAINELYLEKDEDEISASVKTNTQENCLESEIDSNRIKNGNLKNLTDSLPEDCAKYDNISSLENNTEKCMSELKALNKEGCDTASVPNYNSLGVAVKKCLNEIHQPSAPAVQKNVHLISSPVNNLVQQEEKNITAEKPIDINKYSFTMIIEDFLPPFTDEKLAEFYYNPELEDSKNYVDEFINQEINNDTRGTNYLYKILLEYMQSKNRLKVNESQIEDLKEKLKVCVTNMWTIWDDVQVTDKEKCSDGNVVSFVEKYTQAQFNPQIYKEYTSLLGQLKHLVHEVHVMNSFTCSLLRLKIEYYLQCLLTPCPEFTNLEEESPAVLTSSLVNSHFQKCLFDLKVAISTLFVFQRKQTLEVNNNFLEETREWLADLVSVLIRVGNWKDHIFLLNHIMRCPGGVSEWAAQFVQLPFSNFPVDPFNNFELNHMMTVMNILLNPIEQRENFIKKWESELANDVTPWTVIDSDGEVEEDDQVSCPMKENDLVSLLNQIPFSKMFKSILKFETYGGTVSSEYLLKIFSFFTNLINILLSGLKLYSTQKYRQFTKRLGRLIYHIVQYATDSLTVFKSQNVSEHEMLRIQTEYDSFFLRSTKFIYSAKKHGTWQFLATIPYHMASSNTILKLYGILQLNDNHDEKIVKINFQNFEEKFMLLPEEEQFYLLTTFANMALARDIIEIQFIKNVLLQLFYIGFLCPATADHCYKNVKSLLCSICSSYPFLMSEIICIQKNKFMSSPEFDQNLSLYLWMKLPVEDWMPDKRDLETLSNWLLEPIQSVQSELARTILQSLNYGICEGELFMPLRHHQSIASMILKSNTKLVFEQDVGVIKNVSNLVRSQSPEQMFHDWSWNVLLKLRLHLLDRSEAEICKRLCNLTDYLTEIPDLDSSSELQFLVLKKHAIASYIALMTTTLGHSVPIIFDKGFDVVDVLLNAGKYEAGIACLEYMTLLFLDCKDSLYKCEKFIALLSRLMAADNSYVQFAKSLISNNFPGPVLKCLEIMIQNQLNCCKAVDLKKFSNVIQLWLLTLTRLPLWTQTPGVLYLINKLLQNSLFDAVSTKIVSAVLEDLLEANSPPSETKSSFSSLVSWMNSKYVPPSLLPKGFNGEVPWFSYRIIQMEFEIFEKKTSLWAELLKELLSSSEKKTNVDNSLKKVCNHLKIPVRPSSTLAVYKWTYQIQETDISHPLVPLLWQKFFSLYLSRVPGLTDRGSVGKKFFDGVINQTSFKRLKQKLEETCERFKALAEQNEEGSDNDYYLKCYKLFQTYSLWLDDPKLHDPCLSVHMLPIQYNPELLQSIIHGNDTPWFEYLEYQNIEKSFRNDSLIWSKVRNRPYIGKGNKIASRKREKSPLDKINERLNSYESPLPPPRVNLKKYNFPRMNLEILINPDKMILSVKSNLKVLLQYINYYTAGVNENVALACDMQELLPRLYITAEAKKVLKRHCTGIFKTVNGKSVHYSCSGPAVVQLSYEESKLNEQAKQHLTQCEKAFESNVQKTMSAFPPNLTTSAVLIDIVIEELKQEFHAAKSKEDNDKMATNLRNSGVHLFYELVRSWCTSITHTPPVDKAFENYIEALGKTFVEGNAEENDRILHLMLSDDTFGDKISKYYTPNASETHDFIESYSKALKCDSEKRFMILSKFDMSQWLSEKKPKFLERSRMISKIGQGLKAVSGIAEEKSTLKLLNQQLEVLLMYDFPEHYGEILNFLIEASESQSISSSCWYMFLNSLVFGHFAFSEGRIDQNIFEPGQSVKKLKYYFSKFATDQNLISFDVIQGTIALLVSFFKNERLKTGHTGLYRKYRTYVEPICIFFGMLSYSCVAKALEIDTGSLSDKITQQLWPLISDLYSPWLTPYWVENDKQQTGTWVQDQTSDRNVLLPWTTNDSCHASFCASIFVESVRFVFDALPGLNHVLSHAWFFYVTNFANIYVKDYILNVVHDNMFSLPWETFVPSLQDVELMLKVVDQFLPLSHSFLGSIFVNIKWTELVQYYLNCYDLETTTKLHICLLHLLVKLPLEPSLKQNDKITVLLAEANDYAWHLVDHNNYDVVLNWFIMSCDPRIILMDERLEYYKLDSTILRLLRSCAGYVPTAKSFHATTLTKRLMYVRACVKWLITSNRRFKSKDSPLFKVALYNIWSEMETGFDNIAAVPPRQQVDEAGILLSEFLTIFSEPELSPIVEGSLASWLPSRQASVLILGLFRSVGVSVENPCTYGSIIEFSLESYFNFAENCDWAEVTNILVPFSKSKSDAHLDKVFMDNNYILTLYAALHKRFHSGDGFSPKLVLTDLLQFLSEVKPSSELEPKLSLLIIFGLMLAEKEMKFSPKEGVSFLVKFSDTLSNFFNDKGYSFLSAIGLKKSATSNRFKLICLIASGGIAVFLKNSYPEYQEAIDEKLLQALETAENNKVYQNIQQYASYAKTAVKEMSSVEQIIHFLKHIGVKLFNKLYLK